VATVELTGTATAVDLAFGSHSLLRAISEVYAQSDAQEKLMHNVVAAGGRVMNLARSTSAEPMSGRPTIGRPRHRMGRRCRRGTSAPFHAAHVTATVTLPRACPSSR
jgi:hypothetical protein